MSDKYVIFGAGGTGKWFFDVFCNEYDVGYFCDNNPKKQGRKCLGLPVIAPDELPPLLKQQNNMKVIIPPSETHFEKARQLFDMGIKKFCLVNPDNHHEVNYIDLSSYDDITPNPRRICVIETPGIGQSGYALKKYNPFDDIEILLIENEIYEPFSMYSNKTYYYAFHTSALFITQNLQDLHGKKCIELWHGFTIKALWNASYSEHERNNYEIVSKRLNNDRDIVCSYSRLYTIFFGYCAGVPQEKFSITGMPRNDFLLKSDAKTNIIKLFGDITKKHILFYLPTHRDLYDDNIEDSKTTGHLFSWPDFDMNSFNDFLRTYDILFITKPHEYENGRITAEKKSNIKYIDNAVLSGNSMCLYETLGASDLLITDYSSVSVDYLLIDKPIIYAVRDIDEYASTRGLMTEPFDAWTAGDVVKTYEHLKSAISEALNKEDKYKDRREQLRQITHKYTDGGSARRVLESARNML